MIRVDRTGSTNAVLRDLARDGAPHGTAVLARTQTEGKGRLGRSWMTAPGEAVLLSVLIRRALPARQVPLLTLGTAVALAELVPDSGIKWPNDLLAPDGRKLAGILAEAEFEQGRLAWAVIGVGLNVHGHPDLPHATCLSKAFPSRRYDVDTLAEGLLRGILAMAMDRPAEVLERWRARSVTLGRRVKVGEHSGLAEDIDATGALIVDGTRVLAGDVHLV